MPTINVQSMADRYGKNRTRFKPMLVGVVLLAIMLVGVIVFYVVSGSDILTHYTPEEQLVIDWIEENEGDPSSVEMILLEGPRALDDAMVLMRAKYRATGPLGGPVVFDRCFRIDKGTAHYRSIYSAIWPDSPTAKAQRELKQSLSELSRGTNIEDEGRGPVEAPGSRFP